MFLIDNDIVAKAFFFILHSYIEKIFIQFDIIKLNWLQIWDSNRKETAGGIS